MRRVGGTEAGVEAGEQLGGCCDDWCAGCRHEKKRMSSEYVF